MANKITRAWYVDKLKRIGIVEESTNAVTKDGYTTNWKSITEQKDLRIYAISRDADLVIEEVAAGDTLTNTAFAQIPEQFHEILLFKVIAMGYKDPRNFELDKAQYFDNEYNLGVKQAKKFSRSNYQVTGYIKPQDY